jgi:UDP-N-acetylglucosamine 1-carboxyvinyltransferase
MKSVHAKQESAQVSVSNVTEKQEQIVILGGVPLRGEVQVSGSKNSSLPILAASLLATRGQSVLHNVPSISDVDIMCKMISSLGAKVTREDHTVIIDASHLDTSVAPEKYVRQMRASFYVAAPLLARLHCAEVPLPGGCVLGVRPIDYHINAFRKMGAHITVERGAMQAKADRWEGAKVLLDHKNSSVGATVNIMMAACLANGITTIENAAREPEVINLADFLNKMGGRVSGAGTSTITIEGVKELHGAEQEIYNDRIEAGTFVAAAVATRGEVRVRGLSPEHLPVFLEKYQEAGVSISTGGDWIHVQANATYSGVDVSTSPFPGFATDLQPLFLTTMCLAQSKSVIHETIYDGRFNYVPELLRMGADVDITDNTAIVHPVRKLGAAQVKSSDLRAGAALVIASLAAEGRSEISNVKYIDRGYEDLAVKLQNLGAQVARQHLPANDTEDGQQTELKKAAIR